MFKRLLLLGLVAGVLAAVAAVVYQKVYTSSLGADFSGVVKTTNIFVTCILGTLVAATGFQVLQRWLKHNTEPVFNLLFTILTFATILGPFAAKLPLDIEAPELFPGLTVPMHFFPALAWFTLKPLFFRSTVKND